MKKKLKKKNLIIIIIVVLVLLSVGGFGVFKLLNKTDEVKSNDKVIEKDKKEEKKEEPKLQIVDLDSKTRPIAVMINNLGVARTYHTGLQDAYLVYEIIVEGGITRYMALFKDKQPETVGSVRSARHYFLDYALENDAFYVHWGWSPQAQSDIKSLGVNNISGLTYGKPYFFRKSYPVSSEHRGFVNLKEIAKLANKKYRSETNKDLLLNYSVLNLDLTKREDKMEALKVNLKYSNGFTTNYEYDSTANVYKQSVNNKPHTDYETKAQYTVKNIITYQVANYGLGDKKGRQDIKNIGSGEGYFITGGYAIPITWEKKSRSSQTVYKYKATGEEITVNDGNTWIHIVPKTGNIGIVGNTTT